MTLNAGRPLRVLIPSDDHSFVPDQAAAYAGHGCQVVVGRRNLFLSNVPFDIVHLHWPEELVDWREPTAADIARVGATLKRWRRTAILIVTVHNLHPHGAVGSEPYRALYDVCYGQAHIISYFASAAMVLAERVNPVVAGKASVMHGPFGYHSLRRSDVSRESARRAMGIVASKRVVLVFGSLRFWAEIALLMRAYSRVMNPCKHLIYAGRYTEACGRLRYRWRMMRLRAWLASRSATVLNGYVSDTDMHAMLAASDVVVVPRIGALSSGIALMAMTFGPVVVAPDEGVFREFLQGTENPLYVPGDPYTLASALDEALAMDHEAMAVRNRSIGAAWTWERIAGQCLAAVESMGVESIGVESLGTESLEGEASCVY
ncbi:MAG: glycosyltransferase [Gammaproteobacteria bacterium]|nr:glycosyltransferase [Gammaproteobacteria bacterium]